MKAVSNGNSCWAFIELNKASSDDFTKHPPPGLWNPPLAQHPCVLLLPTMYILDSINVEGKCCTVACLAYTTVFQTIANIPRLSVFSAGVGTYFGYCFATEIVHMWHWDIKWDMTCFKNCCSHEIDIHYRNTKYIHTLHIHASFSWCLTWSFMWIQKNKFPVHMSITHIILCLKTVTCHKKVSKTFCYELWNQ